MYNGEAGSDLKTERLLHKAGSTVTGNGNYGRNRFGDLGDAKFAIVFGGDLDAVQEDDGPDEGKTWLETTDAPIADELLSSLRQIMSITYRQDFDDDAEERMLGDIRALAIKALSPLGDMLAKLRLKPVKTDAKDESARVFKYVVVPRRLLNRRVTVSDSDKKSRLGDLVQSAPADTVIRNLRKALSITFSEVFSYNERRKALWEIRQLAAEALVPLNMQLEEIEIEPVGMPILPFEAYHSEGRTLMKDKLLR